MFSDHCACEDSIFTLSQNGVQNVKWTLYEYFYWAAVSTAFLINIGYTITSLTHQYHNRPSITSCIIHLSNHKCSIPSDTNVYNDEVLTAKFAIIPVAVITLLISLCIAKNNDNMMQEKVGCRCSSLKQYLLH